MSEHWHEPVMSEREWQQDQQAQAWEHAERLRELYIDISARIHDELWCVVDATGKDLVARVVAVLHCDPELVRRVILDLEGAGELVRFRDGYRLRADAEV